MVKTTDEEGDRVEVAGSTAPEALQDSVVMDWAFVGLGLRRSNCFVLVRVFGHHG